jgi:hypothetical protein
VRGSGSGTVSVSRGRRGAGLSAALVALLAVAAGGCEKKSELVTAAHSTELRIGDARLTIAPGSLPFDSVIVADLKRPAQPAINGEIRSRVYEFTPRRTVFDPPALLELRSTGDGHGTVIARWDEARRTLTALPTTRSGALLRAPIDRFAEFVEAELGEPATARP